MRHNNKFGHRYVQLAIMMVGLVGMATVTATLNSVNVAAYLDVEASFEGAKQFGDQFCKDYEDDGQVGDIVWLTAMDGSKTVVVEPGQTLVPVIVHAGGKYCNTWFSNSAGSTYWSDNGGINGSINYPFTGKGTYFQTTSPTQKYLNVTGYGTGTMRVCMTLATYTDPKLNFVQSPNACTNLSLIVKKEWYINGQSYVRNNTTGSPRAQGTITANLNDTVHWDHDLRNSGPDNMERDIYYNVDKEGYTGSEAGINGNKDQTGTTRGTFNQLFVTLYASNVPSDAYTVKTIGQQDVGAGYNGRPEICQRIAWKDKAWNDTAWGWSVPWACVRVPYNYNLTPSVSGSSAAASIGASIPQVRASVNNQLPGNGGQTTVSEPVDWQLKRIHIAPNGSIDMSLRESSNAPCIHYPNIACIDKGGGRRTFDPGDTLAATLDNEGVDPADPSLQVGTKICYTLSVRQYSQSSNPSVWRHSVPLCITVSKQPKVQVWGNDLRTRGSIKTGTALLDAAGSEKVFGSWVEYGGFSVGANDGFASGSGLNNGNTNTAPSEWHKLTFANIDNSSSSSFGQYTLDTLPNLTDQFIGAPSGGVFNNNLGTLNSGTYSVGSVTIDPSAVGPGKSIIIVSSGIVEVTGDITYTGMSGDQFTDFRQIPQVIIIAPTINIAEDVTRIDAWLLTTSSAGKINTCYKPGKTETSPLNSTVCNKVLTVNGPVVTQHLHLRRTAGADNLATAGAPAEVFNLRPDAYIWAYARANQSGKAQTVYSVELPPRF